MFSRLIWIRKLNKEIREVFGEPDVVGVIRASRLRWAGHIIRKDAKKITTTIYKSQPEGIRSIDSTRSRRKDQVHKDMQIIGLQEEDARDREVVAGCWRR